MELDSGFRRNDIVQASDEYLFLIGG